MTRLLSLEIVDSKRFALTRIKRIIYTPKELRQIIIGTNGSGKSSLKEEASPLPADLNNTYNRGGGKIVTYVHNGVIHILKSGIDLGRKHSYVVDGEELNRGGTKKVQLELVEEHFGITPWINDFLIGKTNFSSFNVADRKKWLTHIDKLDYTFMLSEFNKYRIAFNDTRGALKVAVSKVDHSIKIMSENEVSYKEEKKSNLIKDSEGLKKEIELYSELKMIPNVREKLNESNERLKELMSNLHSGLRLNDEVDKLKAIKVNISKVDKLVRENNETLLRAEEIDEIKSIDMTDLYNQKEILIKHIKHDNPFGVEDSKVYDFKDNFDFFINRLSSMFDKLDNYKDISELGEDEVMKIESDINIIDAKLEYDRNIRSELNAELTHLTNSNNHDTVECPQCKTSVRIEDNDTRIEYLKQQLEKGDETKYLNGKRKTLIDLKDRYRNRDLLMNEIDNLLADKQLRPFIFFAYNLGDYNMYNNYQPLLTFMTTTSHMMDEYKTVRETMDKLHEVNLEIRINEENISRMSNLDINMESIGTLKERGNRYERELVALNEEHKVLNNTVNKLKEVVDEVRTNRMFQNAHILNHEVATNEVHIKYLNKLLSVVSEKIESLSTELTVNNRLFIERDIQTKNINELKSELEILETLVSALSPNTGIIGDALRSFMDSFLDCVNVTLASVWTYDLKVSPCEINRRGQLDYKFPVRIDGEPRLMDISEGSLSMREIFDLAFRLSSIKLMGLESYPLFLDEFSNNMDDAHKDKVFSILGNLGKGRQLFLISHFVDFYGGLANSEINVLSKVNIRMDSIDVYNKSMKITRK